MPKTRWPTPCERCKAVIEVGTRHVRYAGRRWHPDCYRAEKGLTRARVA